MTVWEGPGKSDEWYTPKYVFDALGVRFDMDVAHPAECATHVPASRFVTANSLSTPWEGFIWMNPPFGKRNEMDPWLDKFFDHGDGVALTPDRTSAAWFRAAWGRADLVMFTPRIRFIRPDGTEGASPANGTALWASGPRGQAALLNAKVANLGIVAVPL